MRRNQPRTGVIGSPFLRCYPSAKVLEVDDDGIHLVDARETEHVRLGAPFSRLDC